MTPSECEHALYVCLKYDYMILYAFLYLTPESRAHIYHLWPSNYHYNI